MSVRGCSDGNLFLFHRTQGLGEYGTDGFDKASDEDGQDFPPFFNVLPDEREIVFPGR